MEMMKDLLVPAMLFMFMILYFVRSKKEKVCKFNLYKTESSSLMYTVAEINKQPYSFLIDTGSSINVLSKKSANRGSLVINDSTCNVHTASGSAVPSEGEVVTDAVLFLKKFDGIEFTVVNEDNIDAISNVLGVDIDGIIGIEFLRNNNMSIDLKSCSISWKK